MAASIRNAAIIHAFDVMHAGCRVGSSALGAQGSGAQGGVRPPDKQPCPEVQIDRALTQTSASTHFSIKLNCDIAACRARSHA